jgi:PIN domain nuclease of toxin-antitoxin system
VGYRQSLTRAFLLDTHVWLWTVEDDARHLGRRTARLIERWAGEDALRVSPLSTFEIAALHASGRLRLSHTPEQWIALALENTRARLAPPPIEAALEAGRIGTSSVPDPIDRLLIGTARYTDATLVTADRRILDYAATRRDLRTHDARR